MTKHRHDKAREFPSTTYNLNNETVSEGCAPLGAQPSKVVMAAKAATQACQLLGCASRCRQRISRRAFVPLMVAWVATFAAMTMLTQGRALLGLASRDMFEFQASVTWAHP